MAVGQVQPFQPLGPRRECRDHLPPPSRRPGRL